MTDSDIAKLRERLAEHVNAGGKMIVTSRIPREPGDIMPALRLAAEILVDQPCVVLREATMAEFIQHHPFDSPAEIQEQLSATRRWYDEPIYLYEVTTD